ncbi:FliH/SctL family protein [Mucisphaera sp.]|uniref:FliH/SctL family protein n=1 Tax=Mucisphaera sp. TaxID=2913024 RepID=UPI003D09C0B7
MPVVRKTQSAPAIKEAIVLDFGDIGAQAARLRQAAEAKAAQIIRQAELQAADLQRGAEEQGVEAGYQDGLEKGHAQGLKQGRQEAFDAASEQLAHIQEAWLDLSTRWETEFDRLTTEAREGLMGFALRFAERLVHRVIEVDREIIVDQLAEALGHILRPLKVSVRINPDDRPILEKALPELLQRFSHLKQVELVDDDQITPGGCIARFGQGQVDATIDTQVQRMVEAILPPLHDEAPPESLEPQSEPAEMDTTAQPSDDDPNPNA